MKVLIDTNLVLDLLLNQKPFVAKVAQVFKQAENGHIEVYLAANSVTDIVYILRKAYSGDQIRENLQNMFGFIKILSVTISDIIGAFKLDISDYEDALLLQFAKAGSIDYIVTRNKKDFNVCPVECLALYLSFFSPISSFCNSSLVNGVLVGEGAGNGLNLSQKQINSLSKGFFVLIFFFSIFLPPSP